MGTRSKHQSDDSQVTGKTQTNPLTVLDLFSGAGGITQGLHAIRREDGSPVYQTIGAIDCWATACRTYHSNHHIKPLCQPVSPSSVEQVLAGRTGVDLVVAGPPCQSFSTSGRRALDDPRSQLVMAFLSAVKIAKPRAFVMENVSGFKSFAGGALLREVCQFAADLDYKTAHQVVMASGYGVPQRRRRFILVGTSDREFDFSSLDEWRLDDELTFRDAVGDLPEFAGLPGDNLAYANDAQNEYQQRMRNGRAHLTEHSSARHAPRMLELLRLIPAGSSAYDSDVFAALPVELRPGSGFKNSYSRIVWDRPAPTITRNFSTPSSANCVHPAQPRALTIREAARCQSFPDTYQFLGSQGDKRLQIANAVPPLLAEVLGRALCRHLDSCGRIQAGFLEFAGAVR